MRAHRSHRRWLDECVRQVWRAAPCVHSLPVVRLGCALRVPRDNSRPNQPEGRSERVPVVRAARERRAGDRFDTGDRLEQRKKGVRRPVQVLNDSRGTGDSTPVAICKEFLNKSHLIGAISLNRRAPARMKISTLRCRPTCPNVGRGPEMTTSIRTVPVLGLAMGLGFWLAALSAPLARQATAPAVQTPSPASAGRQGGRGGPAPAEAAPKQLLEGTDKDDTVTGGDGDDWIFGQKGNDFLQGGAGRDKIDGGEGDDTI